MGTRGKAEEEKGRTNWANMDTDTRVREENDVFVLLEQRVCCLQCHLGRSFFGIGPKTNEQRKRGWHTLAGWQTNRNAARQHSFPAAKHAPNDPLSFPALSSISFFFGCLTLRFWPARVCPSVRPYRTNLARSKQFASFLPSPHHFPSALPWPLLPNGKCLFRERI